MREFTSAPAEDDGGQVPDHEIKFKLDGVEFACTVRGDADSLLGWSELASSASTDVDVESAEGAAFVHRFFTQVMDSGEYRRFRAHLKAHKTQPEILTEIMNEIQAEMQQATEGSSERPTVRPSSSSGGRPDPAQRRLQIASLQGTEEGEVTFAPRPNREARRRLEREQRRAAQQAAAGSAATG